MESGASAVGAVCTTSVHNVTVSAGLSDAVSYIVYIPSPALVYSSRFHLIILLVQSRLTAGDVPR